MAKMKILRSDEMVAKDGVKYIVIDDDGNKQYFDAKGDEIKDIVFKGL